MGDSSSSETSGQTNASGPEAEGQSERARGDVQQAGSVLAQLMTIINQRKEHRPNHSYVVHLLDGGPQAIGAKLIEEAHEVTAAAGELDESGRQESDYKKLIHEVSDVLFHLLVMMGWGNISLAEVEAELARRFGVSGFDEKASRKDQNHA